MAVTTVRRKGMTWLDLAGGNQNYAQKIRQLNGNQANPTWGATYSLPYSTNPNTTGSFQTQNIGNPSGNAGGRTTGKVPASQSAYGQRYAEQAKAYQQQRSNTATSNRLTQQYEAMKQPSGLTNSQTAYAMREYERFFQSPGQGWVDALGQWHRWNYSTWSSLYGPNGRTVPSGIAYTPNALGVTAASSGYGYGGGGGGGGTALYNPNMGLTNWRI